MIQFEPQEFWDLVMMSVRLRRLITDCDLISDAYHTPYSQALLVKNKSHYAAVNRALVKSAEGANL